MFFPSYFLPHCVLLRKESNKMVWWAPGIQPVSTYNRRIPAPQKNLCIIPDTWCPEQRPWAFSVFIWLLFNLNCSCKTKNKSTLSVINQIEPESQRGEVWFSLSTLMFIYKPKSNMTKITSKGFFTDDLLHQVIGLDRYIKKDRAGICYTGSYTYNIFQRLCCFGLT